MAFGILILEIKLSSNVEFRDKRLNKIDHSLNRVPGFLPVLSTYLDRVGLTLWPWNWTFKY